MSMVTRSDEDSPLFQLAHAVQYGDISEVVLTDEQGDPIARLVPIDRGSPRCLVAPDPVDADLPEAARLFRGTAS